MRPADLLLISQTRADLASGRARGARESAKVSQGEAAAVLGVRQSAVSHWEAGRSAPTAEHALAYGRLLAKLGRRAA